MATTEILSQSEVDALLENLAKGELPDENSDESAEPAFQKIDLASEERIVRGRLPAVELVFDRFVRELRASLAKMLGRSCHVNLGSVEMCKLAGFIKQLPLPSSMHVLRMPPLPGQVLLCASTPLVYTVVECLFGGGVPQKSKTPGKEFTAIENRLVGKLVMSTLEDLKNAWSPLHPVDFVYVRSEYNPLAVAIAPPSDTAIVTTIEIEIEEESSTLTLCIPYATLEPIRQKLSIGVQSSHPGASRDGMRRMAQNVKKTKVNLKVRMAQGKIKVRDLLKLQLGDVVPLETHPDQAAVVEVEDLPKYSGSVGTHRGSRSVKFIGPLKK